MAKYKYRKGLSGFLQLVRKMFKGNNFNFKLSNFYLIFLGGKLQETDCLSAGWN